jgi:K+-sensing histidine kinase KdpD
MKRRLPAWLWASIVVAGVLVLGLVDWLTGYELNFFVFYFLPVSVAAWFLGFGSSVIMAVLSALVWFGADVLSEHVYSSHVYAVWSITIRLVSFLAIGWSVSRMRQALARERNTAESLRRALSEIKVLEAFLPICAQCKKIRNEQGVWEPLEVYIGQHSKTQFSHGYCPECAKKALEEAGL